MKEFPTTLLQHYRYYFVAQIKLTIILTMFYALSLSYIHVPYGLLLGIGMTGLHLVPVIETAVSFIPWIVYHLMLQEWNQALLLGLIWILGLIIKEVMDTFFVSRDMLIPCYLPILVTFLGGLLFNLWGIILSWLIIPLIAAIINTPSTASTSSEDSEVEKLDK